MRKSTTVARTGLLAVLLAMVGFSYSLATSNTETFGEVAARAVGTNPPLAFANPFAFGGTDRDLGDAVAGSALTRLCRAKGGIAPYTFTAAGTAVNGLLQLTTLASAQLQLLSNGIFTTIGTQCSPNIPAGPFRFQVTVKDSFGTTPHSVTETFRLRFVTTTVFRFADSQLSDGVQYRPYSDVCAVINGKAPYTFTSTGLAGTGLSVSTDGAVFGVPIKSGAITFVVTAKDANGSTALGRNGTGTSQTFTINVSANTVLSSIFSATSIVIKEGNGTDHKGVGRDSIGIKGVVNLGAESISSLSGKPFSVRIGAYVSPTAFFDGRGTATTAKKVTPAVKATVKKLGVAAISVTHDTINVGPILGGGTVNLAVEVRFGDGAIGSEYLAFTVKTGRGNSVTLTYKGTVPSDLGGAGQLLKVQGADDKAGTGDAWKVAFIGRIPAALGAGTVNNVNVAIGQNYSNTVTLTNKNGKLTAKGSNKSPVVSAFSLDTNKGKGTYTTGVLPAVQTAIPQASKAPTTNTFFANSLTFSTGTVAKYGIDGSLAIFAQRTKWSSK